MRKILAWTGVGALIPVLVACVTINVYFPEAQAQQAAEQFIDQVIGPNPPDAKAPVEKLPPGHSPGAFLLNLLIPSAYAQSPDIRIQTPQIKAIQSRMKQRFDTLLSRYFASGAVGFTDDGLVAVHDAAGIPLAERASVNAAVADENRDRNEVYREIATANGHAEWEAQIRQIFAREWISHARPGWYYQDAGGAWKKKE